MIPLAVEQLDNGHIFVLAAENWGEVKKFVESYDKTAITLPNPARIGITKEMPLDDCFCRAREWIFVCSALREYKNKHTKYEQSDNIQDDDIG